MGIVLVLAALLTVQDSPVETLIEQLRSSDIEERERAARALLKLGKGAVPAVERAVRDPDLEVAQRARGILKRLDPSNSQEALENIEETLLRAKTLRIVFKGGTEVYPDSPEGFKTVVDGELLVREGNRLVYRLRQGREGAEVKSLATFISDGTQMAGGPGTWVVRSPSPNLAREMILGVSRLGPTMAVRVAWSLMGFMSGAVGADMESSLKVSTFGPHEVDGEAGVLGYTAPPVPFAGSTGRIWYERLSYRPLKRTLELPGRRTIITESFDAVVLNGDIPDDAFKLPDPDRGK